MKSEIEKHCSGVNIKVCKDLSLFILKKSHILMFVCALDPFKKGWRNSNEVINRKTLFLSQYQSLKRHEIIFHEKNTYFDACLCSRSVQQGLETF